MTNEEAIRILIEIEESIKPYSRWWRYGYKKALKKAIEALEKQVQKKVIRGSERYSNYCPCCHNLFDRTTKHCDYCGQKIDWSDEE